MTPRRAVEAPRLRHWRAALLAPGGGLLVLAGIWFGLLPPAAGLIALGGALAGLLWTLRAHAPSILLVFLGVLLAGAVVSRPALKLWPEPLGADDSEALSSAWNRKGPFQADLPIVVHLVFDEMMATGAMTPDVPSASVTRQALLEVAGRHGLRLYDSVYSRYYYSGKSLPNLMSAEYAGRTGPGELDLEIVAELPGNEYFADLADRGYRTAVFQTSLIDFCASPHVKLCETFDSFDPAGYDPRRMDLRNRTAHLWSTLVRAYEPSYTSRLLKGVLSRAYGTEIGALGVDGTTQRFDVQRFPGWFERFSAFAATVPRGSHLFGHFMVPHAPYLLTESCLVSGRYDSGYELMQFADLEQRAAKRADMYTAYLAQVRCLAQKLDELLTQLEQAPAFRDATIVIHGDHGSRISNSRFLEDYTERDFVDNYGTFFAVKGEGIAPGLDCEFVSLPQIFRRILRGQEAGDDPPLPVLVASRARGEQMVEAPMPLFGCASDDERMAYDD